MKTCLPLSGNVCKKVKKEHDFSKGIRSKFYRPDVRLNLPICLDEGAEKKATMATITISLPADRLQQLREVATQYHVAPEDLVRASVEEMLARPEEEFKQAVDYVLNKNAELYRRLAF